MRCGHFGDGQKPQAAISVQSAPSEHCARFQLGFGQPLACAKYPYMDQCYGVFSTYGPQVSPYVHYSRHLHAMRRRFLNKKSLNSDKEVMEMKKAAGGQVCHPTGSQSFEESNGGGSILSRSEVISMNSRGDLEHLSINHLGLSVHSFPLMMDDRRGTVMPSKWVATIDNCCNLKV
ncbi:hypothetical protein ERO13_D09G129550v2 [Gossypium hirsutum]|uniref:Nuclear transcription factor Y subunit n=4 Tax=Gossypium TaxID=3633 RepID=A0A0D2NSX6_GOSRA|nr:hypothetical protein ERO13_D09G129550v2 [Gossypium hirsutum]KJB36247.1 hypothetical protein B456_006G148400 [Gossypium raimondii]TYG54092.1 hypothetical protein ES288_D09G161500v1 [Gossypium darwinii]